MYKLDLRYYQCEGYAWNTSYDIGQLNAQYHEEFQLPSFNILVMCLSAILNFHNEARR